MVGKRSKELQLSRFKWCCEVLSSLQEFEHVKSVRYFVFMDIFTKELLCCPYIAKANRNGMVTSLKTS